MNPIIAIADEAQLVAFARDLGAERFGGVLSAVEKKTIAKARAIRSARPVLAALRESIRSGKDPLGETLCRIRSPLAKRVTGAFYTPAFIVQPMVAWALKQKPKRFVDAGCGSGRFTHRVLTQSPGARIVAVDADPVATLLTRAMLAVVKAKNVTVINADYLRVKLPRIAAKTAFIGNPPYVRHHGLSVGTKASAMATAKRLGHSVSGLAGLHALFFLATAALAKKGDIGCFVTSAEWMDTNYGSIVRDLMTNGLGGRGVHAFAANATAFEDAMTTAAISYFEVGSEPTHIALLLSDEPRSRRALGSGATPVSRELLMRSKRWSPMLKNGGVENIATVPLRQIARVHRGVATGANDYFVMSKARAGERGILAFCTPVITRAKEIQDADGIIRDSEDRMVVLTVPANIDRHSFPALDAYLKLGEKRIGDKPAVCEGWISAHRTPWYSVTVRKPQIVATYMSRSAVRFAYNPDGLALLNVGHGIYPHTDMNDESLRRLASQLNEMREQFVGMGRTYHGGLEKFEPGEMEQLPVPAEFEHVGLAPILA